VFFQPVLERLVCQPQQLGGVFDAAAGAVEGLADQVLFEVFEDEAAGGEGEVAGLGVGGMEFLGEVFGGEGVFAGEDEELLEDVFEFADVIEEVAFVDLGAVEFGVVVSHLLFRGRHEQAFDAQAASEVGAPVHASCSHEFRGSDGESVGPEEGASA